MVAVIFEVLLGQGKKPAYLDLASQLKQDLTKIDGFISIERFQSLTHPEKLLSLSYWENEEAVSTWRNLEIHREAQLIGRNEIFLEYQLKVCQLIRDYGMHDRVQAPIDSQFLHKK